MNKNEIFIAILAFLVVILIGLALLFKLEKSAKRHIKSEELKVKAIR